MNGSKACQLIILIASIFIFSACGEEERTGEVKFQSFPIKGKLTVNGTAPKYAVTVMFHYILEKGKEKRFPKKIFCDETGAFKTRLGAGDYKVTFFLNATSLGKPDEPTDLFENKYSDWDNSKFKITVKEDAGEEETDLGDFPLEAEINFDKNKLHPRNFQKKFQK